jgi:hypothetical protein
MSRRNLSKTGLSLSQAQSISNLCFQRTQDIASELSGINNVSKTFEHGGNTLTETTGKPLPSNVVELILEKSKLHACQAFLMEHIKLKDRLIKEAQKASPKEELERPEHPEYKDFKVTPSVDEPWGWDQLTNAEKNEYLDAEAYAAHVGQFIHKNGVLDNLRSNLPHIKTLEFIELKKDEKTPMKVEIHHTPEQLLELHNKLAAEHRVYEQKVNFYKAKVKNLVTEENARIAKVNGDTQAKVNAENQILRDEYQKQLQNYHGKVSELTHEFENWRQNEIKELAGLRIEIAPRFQSVIDQYLTQVTTE